MNRRIRRAAAQGREGFARFLRQDHATRRCAVANARGLKAGPACAARGPREEPEQEPLFAVRFRAAGKPTLLLAARDTLPASRRTIAGFLRACRMGGAWVRRTFAGKRVEQTRYRAWQVYEVIHAGQTCLVWSESA
jgi:hypothetical protein